MANEQFTIDLGDQQAVLVTDDDAWLREKLRQEPGATRIRVRYDEDEVEGHRYGAGLGVRVIAASWSNVRPPAAMNASTSGESSP